MRNPARGCSGQGRPKRDSGERGWRCLLFVAALLIVMPTSGTAWGQTSPVDNVGVDTKAPPPVKDDATPITPGLKLRPGERLRVDVNLVMVPVTVTDGL